LIYSNYVIVPKVGFRLPNQWSDQFVLSVLEYQPFSSTYNFLLIISYRSNSRERERESHRIYFTLA